MPRLRSRSYFKVSTNIHPDDISSVPLNLSAKVTTKVQKFNARFGILYFLSNQTRRVDVLLLTTRPSTNKVGIIVY